MSELQALVQAVLSAADDASAQPAQAELARRGAAAVDPIVNGVQSSKGPARRRLADTLPLINDPSAVPLLVPLIHGKERVLRGPVIDALTQLPDESAVEPLLERWRRSSNPFVAKALVATADPRVRPAFEDWLGRWSDEASGVSRAVAEMTRVDVGTLEAIAPLFQNCEPQQVTEILHAVAVSAEGAVRERAILAMWTVVGPGCVDAIRASLADPVTQNRQYGVFAAYFLGVGALVPDLVAVGTSDSDPKVSATAREALMRIGGLPLTHEAPSLDAVRAWFEQTGQYLEPGTAYRGGQPIHPRIVAGMIEREPRGPADRAFEFELLTGAGLPHRASDGVPAEEWGPLAVEWAEAHADAFVPGALYRGGVRIEVSE